MRAMQISRYFFPNDLETIIIDSAKCLECFEKSSTYVSSTFLFKSEFASKRLKGTLTKYDTISNKDKYDFYIELFILKDFFRIFLGPYSALESSTFSSVNVAS